MYNDLMELYVFDVTALAGRESEAMDSLPPWRRRKAARLRRESSRLQSMGAGLLFTRFFPGREAVFRPGGKPSVPGGREFSLSHSGTLALIALADVPVGADIQQLRPVTQAARSRVLTPGEREEGDFFALWTRKEAALKCLGTGLGRDLRAVDARPDTVVLDGKTLSLYTQRYGDFTISAAAEGAEAYFTPQVLTLDDLLPRKE